MNAQGGEPDLLEQGWSRAPHDPARPPTHFATEASGRTLCDETALQLAPVEHRSEIT